MKEIPEASGSPNSRKFFLTVGCIALLTFLCLLSVFYPALSAILPVFIGGLLGILSLYFTGNIANKYVVGKVLNSRCDNGYPVREDFTEEEENNSDLQD